MPNDKLIKAMDMAHMTQKELAKASHISDDYVRKLVSGEREKPSPDVVLAIGKALGKTEPESFGLFYEF